MIVEHAQKHSATTCNNPDHNGTKRNKEEQMITPESLEDMKKEMVKELLVMKKIVKQKIERAFKEEIKNATKFGFDNANERVRHSIEPLLFENLRIEEELKLLS